MNNFEREDTSGAGNTLPDLDWTKQNGVVAAVVQDRADGTVLMCGVMDPPALAKTLETGKVSFFSRTRGVPWTKGETSGNFLQLTDMAKDCEGGDTLVVLAEPVGPTCSEGGRSCFDGQSKQIVGDVVAARVRWALGGRIAAIDETLAARQSQIEDMNVTSYTLGLLRNPNKALKKFGEESLEFAQAVIEEDAEAAAQELADFVYAALVLARSSSKAVTLERVMQILVERNQPKDTTSATEAIESTEGAQDGNAC